MIAISRSTTTAVWAWDREPDLAAEADLSLLEQASGRFGAPLHAASLTTKPLRISVFDLGLGSELSASWLGRREEHGHEVGLLYRAVGSPSGGRTLLAHSLRLLGPDGEPLGFANDDEGDTAFAYEPAVNPEGTNAVALAVSVKGHLFSRGRVVGRVQGLTQPELVAGGRRSLLLTWTDESNRIYAQRGSVFGPFGKPVFVAKEEGSYDAFLDGHGRAIILYDRRVAHHRGLWEEVAVIAQPGGRYSHPRRIAPPLPAGVLGLGKALAAVSPDGHAVILIGQEARRKYMVRYTP